MRKCRGSASSAAVVVVAAAAAAAYQPLPVAGRWYADPSTNGGRRFYPASDGHGEDCCMTNFTCLVGIPLSDMSEEGSGNVGLMRGSHHDMQAFLNRQVRETVAPATLILSAPAPPFVSLVMVYCLTHVWRATHAA